MKTLYSVIEKNENFLVCAKGTPLYAGTVGGARYSSLEEDLYKQYKVHYKVLYPMDYWCSGIVPLVLESSSIIWEGDTIYTYEVIVHNPLFFKEETTLSQKMTWKGKKFIIHPEGEEFQATFSIKKEFKDFSHLVIKSKVPFHQGVLLLTSFLGSPVLGDRIYGLDKPLYLSDLKKRKYKPKEEEDEKPLIGRSAIHLSKLEKGKDTWEAPYPKDFQAVLHNLQKYNTRAEEQFLDAWLEQLKS